MNGILMRKLEEAGGSSIFSVRELDDEDSSGKSADSGDSVRLSTSNHVISYQSIALLRGRPQGEKAT
uniref:Cysteine/serine-rich nuclear protein 3 n=1 Tax=Sphaerodactylus townsendi TaxID=933632 RepID=A0ACB8G0L9_9SAUR